MNTDVVWSYFWSERTFTIITVIDLSIVPIPIVLFSVRWHSNWKYIKIRSHYNEGHLKVYIYISHNMCKYYPYNYITSFSKNNRFFFKTLFQFFYQLPLCWILTIVTKPNRSSFGACMPHQDAGICYYPFHSFLICPRLYYCLFDYYLYMK